MTKFKPGDLLKLNQNFNSRTLVMVLTVPKDKWNKYEIFIVKHSSMQGEVNYFDCDFLEKNFLLAK